ncbi:hypothetical protein BCR34DRAFT_48879 [Clohesyomyces aquaticus]|uniref:Uncharacterized protein n=1 Tax=Clohesyomyces aquaticus TaxID=1231657 RepID=A0A1Y1Z4K3_9PLEO|nr:hypothetical protein BCR34DRAFT_48879 [Clohesyomyces aquaticus]
MDVQFDPFTLTYGLLMDENADKDCKENEWEFRSLNYDAGDTKIPEAIPLEPHEIDNWVERTTSMIKPPGLDLLLARHQRFGSQDIPSKWFPLRPARMRRVFRGLSLHEAFFDMRVLSAQAGGMNFYTSRNEKNEVTELNFLIRPAHSSHFQYSSNWSWAFTWNACTGRMTGFLDGMTDQDIDDLKLYLKSASPELGHPLMLPELLLSLIYKHLNVRIRIPAEQDYFAIERGAGISRVQSEGTVWDWSPERFQDSTKKANTFMTTLAYLQGRFPFARQLAERMAKTLKRLETEEFADSTIKERLITGRAKRAERLENWLYQFQTATNQVAS